MDWAQAFFTEGEPRNTKAEASGRGSGVWNPLRPPCPLCSNGSGPSRCDPQMTEDVEPMGRAVDDRRRHRGLVSFPRWSGHVSSGFGWVGGLPVPKGDELAWAWG